MKRKVYSNLIISSINDQWDLAYILVLTPRRTDLYISVGSNRPAGRYSCQPPYSTLKIVVTPFRKIWLKHVLPGFLLWHCTARYKKIPLPFKKFYRQMFKQDFRSSNLDVGLQLPNSSYSFVILKIFLSTIRGWSLYIVFKSPYRHISATFT